MYPDRDFSERIVERTVRQRHTDRPTKSMTLFSCFSMLNK